jgi:hypothetical protein
MFLFETRNSYAIHMRDVIHRLIIYFLSCVLQAKAEDIQMQTAFIVKSTKD